ncbi:hypothetical protein AB8O52_00695 [Mycoplasmopsis arginini]|uniref:hypothetical protein n=1 Tax=Mycoplasmopsis arginini TaxID=2094 RepID=UPI003519AAF1
MRKEAERQAAKTKYDKKVSEARIYATNGLSSDKKYQTIKQTLETKINEVKAQVDSASKETITKEFYENKKSEIEQALEKS